MNEISILAEARGVKEHLQQLLRQLDVELPVAFQQIEQAFMQIQVKCEQNAVFQQAGRLKDVQVVDEEAKDGLKAAIDRLEKAKDDNDQQTVQKIASFVRFLEQRGKYSPSEKLKLSQELMGVIPEKLLSEAVFDNDASQVFITMGQREVCLETIETVKEQENNAVVAERKLSDDPIAINQHEVPKIVNKVPLEHQSENISNMRENEQHVNANQSPFQQYADAFYPKGFKPEDWHEEIIAKKEGKKFSVNSFSNGYRDMPGSHRNAACNIANMIQGNGVCFPGAFVGLNNNNAIEVMTAVLDRWYKEGLLRRCKYKGKKFYKYTDKFLAGFGNETFCNLLHIKRSDSRHMHSQFDCLRAATCLSRIEFQKMGDVAKDNFIFEFVIFSAQAVYDSASNCLMVSIFSQDDAEKFCSSLRNSLEKTEREPGQLLVTSFDLQHAHRVADMVKCEITELTPDITVLHELSGKYIDYPDEYELSVDEAWNKLKLVSSEEDDGVEDSVPESMARSKKNLDDALKPQNQIMDAEDELKQAALADKSEHMSNEPNDVNHDQEELSRQNGTLNDPIPVKHEEMQEAKVIEEAYLPNEHDIYMMLKDGYMYAAVAYAQAAGSDLQHPHEEWLSMAQRLAYAVNLPGSGCNYSGEHIYSLFTEDYNHEHGIEAPLYVAAALRASFYDQRANDYLILSLYEDIIKNLPLISNRYKNLGNVFYHINEFRKKEHRGLEAYTDLHHIDILQAEDMMTKLRHEANEAYEHSFGSKVRESSRFERFVKTQQHIFATEGDLGLCMKDVAEGRTDKDSLEIMHSLLKEYMYEGDNVVQASFAKDKIDTCIDHYWDCAAEEMTFSKKHERLVSTRRERLRNKMERMLGIIQSWVRYAEMLGNGMSNAETEAYRATKDELLPVLKSAIEELAVGRTATDADMAGAAVLKNVLLEIKGSLEGDWKPPKGNRHFLLTDDVQLEQGGGPELTHEYDELPDMSILLRLVNHTKAMHKFDPSVTKTWKERLQHLMDIGNDYGAATSVAQYLHENGAMSEEEISNLQLDICYAQAEKQAENQYKDFLRRLELWQSYGRISAISGQKDHLRSLVESAFRYAKEESKNFGFFQRVMCGCEQWVDHNASERGEKLYREYEALKNELREIKADGPEMQCMAKVQEMMEKQNFTVAEGMMNGMRRGEFFSEQLQLDSNDWLGKFLDERRYIGLYREVSDGQRTVQRLLHRGSQPRNKEERSGDELVQNWVGASGIEQHKDSLKRFLGQMEFKVESIEQTQQQYDKAETWHVKLTKAQGYHNHPIAAFGSGAISEGFRLAVVRGRYKADGLLSLMRSIGDSEHTIIMLDWALTLEERRRLARKVKEAKFVHVFAVLDRVMLNFLVKNYKTLDMQSMLMQLIIPFANCQPYVPESTKYMPPEIFKGRRDELQAIKDPEGVNIVYGGRQLGKSRLLTMACTEINHDDRGDRAIYVSVKDQGYRETAKYVSEQLLDEKVLLDSNFQHDDWHELARALKNRLRDEHDRIPYLLLLIDEGDKFLESCAAVNYSPIDSLKDVMNVGHGRFKFVIAGLRNVVRFDRRAALGCNASITHLAPLTVKPFNNVEARELLEDPLRYLGIYFGDEELIYLICASANYFPGLIQLYCQKLVETIAADYAGMDEATTPKYIVREEQIQRVLANPEFINQVREKFMITLWLDEDNVYYTISLLLASLYHDRHIAQGYSVDDLKSEAEAYEVNSIMRMNNERLTAFLDEMCDLYILTRSGNCYLFSMDNFLELMGSYEDVQNGLLKIISQEASA